MRVVVVAIVIAWTCQLAHATPAAAGQPPTSPVEAPAVASYRGQTLLADGVAVGLFILSAQQEEATIGGIGIAVYLVGAPLVHLTKPHRGTHALASLAMRAGLPLLGVLIGDAIPRDCGRSPCMGAPSGGVMVGLLGGIVAASALDAIVLAKGDAPKKTPQASWTPVAGPTRGGVALGVAGQF